MKKWGKDVPKFETGVIMQWNDEISTGIAFWQVWFKGVDFGEFNSLREASTHLQKLMDLDNTREKAWEKETIG